MPTKIYRVIKHGVKRNGDRMHSKVALQHTERLAWRAHALSRFASLYFAVAQTSFKTEK